MSLFNNKLSKVPLGMLDTDVQNKFTGYDTSLAQLTTQVMNPKLAPYNAKGDGTTDDTNALQNAINALPNGGIFMIPAGTYRISSIDLSSKSNCTFYFYGTFKLLDGITPVYGSVKVGGNGNTFYNLSIDGNRSKVIDPNAFGVTCDLLVKNTSQNMHFYNLSLTNSIMTACIFDGKAYNVVFDGFTVQNCGEHAFYVSGGLSHSVYWKNGTIDSINLDPFCAANAAAHESYFVKSRGDTLGNNYDFFFENIIQTQTTPAQVSVHFIDFGYADNFYVKKVKLGSNVNFIITHINGNKITVDDLTNTGGAVIYTTGSSTVDIIVKNSKINGGQTNYNAVRYFENCDITLDQNWQSMDTTGYTNQKTSFKNCRIYAAGGLWRHSHVLDDFEFINCDITSTAASSVGNTIFAVGNTLVTSGKWIKFINCRMVTTNYSNLINIMNNTLNILISSCTSDGSIVGSVNNIIVHNLYTTNLNTAIFGQALTVVGKQDLHGIYYNGVDFTKKKYQMTINSGATTSATHNTQYEVTRKLTTNDIIIMPFGISNGITTYYATLDATNLIITINASPAPSANTTFLVLVDVTMQ